MKDCTFCRIYKAQEGIIYEDKYFFAQFDKFPISPGHAEIIPKRHVDSLLNLTKEEWRELQGASTNVIRIVSKTNFRELYQSFLDNPLNEKSSTFCRKMFDSIGIDKTLKDYNIGINEGEAAGRTIHHLHIHIIPRFLGDVEDYVGGVRHIIPGMGNYKK